MSEYGYDDKDKSFHKAVSQAIFAGALCVIALFAVSGYGCMISNQYYYAAMNKCVESGGNWIPTRVGDSSTAICLMTQRVEQ